MLTDSFINLILTDKHIVMKKILLILIFASFNPLFADISIDSPGAGGVTIASAPDYATEVLNNPWDMDSKDDLAEFIHAADYAPGITDHNNFTFTNGIFGLSILDPNTASFHMLSPGQPSTNPLGKNGQRLPIDPTRYRYAIVRMYTDTASEMRFLWNTGDSYADKYVRTASVPTEVGWHTYVVDLQTIGDFARIGETRAWNAVGNVTGFRIEPGTAGNIQIDWVKLAGSASGNYTINYTFTPAGDNTRYSLFIDDDNNPFNGTIDDVVLANDTGSSYSYDPKIVLPGVYKVVGFVSDDFSILHGHPWDMDSSGDLSGYSGFSSASFSSGRFSGNLNATNAFVSLNNYDYPIDTSKFRYLTISARFPSNGNGRVRFYNYSTGNLAFQHNFATGTGDQIINLDLAALGGGSWSGNMGVFHFQPGTNTSSGNVRINYIALRENGYSATEPTATARVSAGNLIINDPPRLQVLQPDPKGGVDFASTVLNNPWNMDRIQDVESVVNVSEAWIYPNNYVNGRQGDFFCATNKEGNEDPYQVSFQTTKRADDITKIDASRFKNATIDFYVGAEQDVVNGSVLRLISWNMKRDEKEINGDDTMIQHKDTDWEVKTQDMTKLKLEPALHPPGSYPVPPWAGYFEIFRADIHEFTNATTYCIDSIELRADDEANNSFALTYKASDSNTSSSSVGVSWYYNTTESTTGGTLITSNPKLSDNTRVHVWNTSAMPNGTYWIYAVASDGTNSTTKMGHRLVINHSLTEDETNPTLVVSSPSAGQQFKNKLRIQGYAIDNTQVALVEALIDGTLVHTFQPNRFDKTARDLYRTNADASKAGFKEDISITGISTGSHTLLLKVWDTAGNFTTQSINFTRASGTETLSPDVAVDEARVAIPLNGKTTELKFTKGKYSPKKRRLNTTIINTQGCQALDIRAHYDATIISTTPELATVIETIATPSAETIILSGTKIRGFKKDPLYGNGRVIFGVYCDSQILATKVFAFSKGKKSIADPNEFLTHLATQVKLK